MSRLITPFTETTGVEVPIICGAMYPCSNPELIAAVSAAGGMGIIQPVSMVYAHDLDLREGLRSIRAITDKPVGFNAIVEKSSKTYEDRMRGWIDVALEEGVRFFVTALGNPDWVCKKVHAAGGVVYHNVTERKWAQKAADGGVDGFICVNDAAGGHAGVRTPRQLMDQLGDLGKPLVCAGGIGSPDQFIDALDMGFAGVQMGTRFIATPECSAHADHKAAIVDALAKDIVLTERISGVPVAVINTPFLERNGLKASWAMKRVLQHRKFKHYGRMYYTLKSLWRLKQTNKKGMGYKDFYQAGRSVEGVTSIEPAGDIVRRFAHAARDQASA